MTITVECPDCKALKITHMDIGDKVECYICARVYEIKQKTVVG